jgi:hypothetical protein
MHLIQALRAKCIRPSQSLFSVEAAQTPAASQPLADELLAFSRRFSHALISVRDSKQIVSGPRCGEPLRYSARFLRAFSPKAFIHVRHLCHWYHPSGCEWLRGSLCVGGNCCERCDGNTNVSAAATRGGLDQRPPPRHGHGRVAIELGVVGGVVPCRSLCRWRTCRTIGTKPRESTAQWDAACLWKIWGSPHHSSF